MTLRLDVLQAVDAAVSAALPAGTGYHINAASLDARAGEFPAVVRMTGADQIQAAGTGVWQRTQTIIFLLALGPIDPGQQDAEFDAAREMVRTALLEDAGLWALISDIREAGADAPVEDDQRGRQRYAVQAVEYAIDIHTDE